MRSQWLQRNGSDRLILVFGGWGLGPGPFEALVGEDDALFVEDFRVLDLDPSVTLAYAKTSLLAFSFGVASAMHWISMTNWRPDRLVAVNGTAYPSDREKGISPERVTATADNLTNPSFSRFVRRCGSMFPVPEIDIPERQAELHMIIDRGSAPMQTFDRIWVSRRDQIIPPKAQLAGWCDQPQNLCQIDAPHLPFASGQRWDGWLT